jgi:hypothetical protein
MIKFGVCTCSIIGYATCVCAQIYYSCLLKSSTFQAGHILHISYYAHVKIWKCLGFN